MLPQNNHHSSESPTNHFKSERSTNSRWVRINLDVLEIQ